MRAFSGSEMLGIQEHLVEHGFALAFYDEIGRTSTVFVIRAVGKQDAKQIERVRRYVFMSDETKPLPNSKPLRGRSVFKFGDQQDSDRDKKRTPRAR